MSDVATDVDVLIVGAGLSGIGAGYHLQTNCPQKSYEIVEARDTMGGTWDLFRYPGIRSDSDMYTLGYVFRPWTDPKAIADGPSILAYIKDTATHYGIDKKITYGHKVEHASWSTKDSRWTVTLRNTKTGAAVTRTCRFLYACAGYYDYDAGYTPDLEGRDSFQGTIVHPQHWPEDLNYDNKRVVVIGSGATAVTLVPEMAKRAKHVVMLQRSPTYIITRPTQDKIADILRAYLPSETAYAMSRWKNVLMSMAFYAYCRAYPARAKKILVGEAKRQLRKAGKDNVEHFTPSYNPWDQRICLVPDSDLFKVIQDGSASVITDHIERISENGILLRSGREIEADVIVTATGLKIKFIGGARFDIDGHKPKMSELMIYKGMMCSDVPNFAFAIGYTNASWTLKCDLASAYVCRLLNFMDAKGFAKCLPRKSPHVKEEPLMDFTSGYVLRAIADLPRQGSVLPWKLYQNYIRDRWMFNRGKLDDGSVVFS